MTRAPVLNVNLKAIAQNYQTLQQRAPKTKIAAAIKADAYGLGMTEVALVLYEAGCRVFFTAQAGEALALRNILLSRKDVEIYCLSGPGSDAESTALIAHDIIPVLNSRDQIEGWNAKAKAAGTRYPAIIHYDTGMNRLGLSGDEADWALTHRENYSHVEIKALMTHPVNADVGDDPLTETQFKLFKKVQSQAADLKYSFCNSSALFLDNQYHLDMARPGIALYGGNPTPDLKNPMQPVVSLTAPILQTRSVKAGESTGYGPDYVFEKDALLATIGIGYADGLMRSLGNRGVFYLNDRPCPIRGRISMDLTVIEIPPDMPAPKPGDQVEILGKNQDIDQLAKDAGTISYEILTTLGKQLQKCYAKS